MFEMLTGNKLKKMQGHFGQVGCLLAHHFEQVRDKEGEKERGRGKREQRGEGGRGGGERERRGGGQREGEERDREEREGERKRERDGERERKRETHFLLSLHV